MKLFINSFLTIAALSSLRIAPILLSDSKASAQIKKGTGVAKLLRK